MISELAKISPTARIGTGTRIDDNTDVGDGAIIGAECIIHDNVCIDRGVTLGNRCKVQRNASIFKGAVLEDGVFIGPSAIVLNDRVPRAINGDGSRKAAADWQAAGVTIKFGASVGGGAVVCPGVTIGRWAMIGAGAVVTRDVPNYGLAYGNPARCVGFVAIDGTRLAAGGGSALSTAGITPLSPTQA